MGTLKIKMSTNTEKKAILESSKYCESSREKKNQTAFKFDGTDIQRVLLRHLSRQDSEKEFREAFDVFDKKGNGYIAQGKLRTMLKSLEEDMTEEEIAQVVENVDIDGDGLISYDEFVEIMNLSPL